MSPTPAAGRGAVLAVGTEAEAQEEVRGLWKSSGSEGQAGIRASKPLRHGDLPLSYAEHDPKIRSLPGSPLIFQIGRKRIPGS